MARSKIETVREGFAGWNAGDMDRVRAVTHPDVVMHMLPDWPEPGPFEGVNAVVAQWTRMRETFMADIWEYDSPDEPIVEINGKVLARVSWLGEGTGPGMAMRLSVLFALKDGKVVEIRNIWDHDEAVAMAEGDG